ncbi:MAG: PQQ-binding-like beta-propeller repeat protein, partial [Bryobacteraceae bacterium]
MTGTGWILRWAPVLASLAWLSGQIQAQELPSARQQFARLCSVCHGADARGGDRGPALVDNRELRSRPEKEIADLIRNGVSGGMPPFALPANQLQALAQYVRSFNASAFDAKPPGDVAAGERYFFGKGRCGSCHMVRGRGHVKGPDLSNIARQLTLTGLERDLDNPGARITEGWGVADVRLADGSVLRGFLRSQGRHDLQLQTLDGRLHLLLESEYKSVSSEKTSLMPALQAAPEDRRDLLAYLSGLGGVIPGPLASEAEPVPPAAIQRILHPRPGEWPTYYGDVSGNRHSSLNQINTQNVGRLEAQWTYSIPYFGLEMTPLEIGGVLYVTGPNQVYALDARTGREIWRFVRPRTSAGTIAGDAAKGVNRGAAALGDRIFFVTDNAHLICLNRLTGAPEWEVRMPEEAQRYGGTVAPLVARDLVIAGVAGADEGIRGFIAAYKATTGQLVWRVWT